MQVQWHMTFVNSRCGCSLVNVVETSNVQRSWFSLDELKKIASRVRPMMFFTSFHGDLGHFFQGLNVLRLMSGNVGYFTYKAMREACF